MRNNLYGLVISCMYSAVMLKASRCRRSTRRKVEKRLIDVKHDQWGSSHLIDSCPLRVRDSGHAGEEIADDDCDLGAATLQGKMTSIEQMDYGLWVVAFEGLCTGRQKEGIVLAPNRE